jgi:hypothetical protein
MRALILLFFLSTALSQSPLWSQNEEYAVYTSAGIVGMQPAFPMFSAATWLNAPVYAEAFKADTTGVPVWHYDSSNTEAEFRTSTARHIDTTSVGPIDIAVGEFTGPDDNCVLYGFASTGTGTPAWTYTIPQCYVDDVDQTYTVLQISDDGSTVGYAVMSNYSQSGGFYPSPTNQLHLLNAQTGQLLFIYDLGPSIPASGGGISSDRHGATWAYTVGAIVYIINSPSGTLRTAPINKGYASATNICPMGTFLTYGYEDAVVAKWNSTTLVYDTVLTISGNDQWIVWTSATSVNGGGSMPNGCLVSFGWTNYAAKRVRVDVYSMLNYNKYWTWYSSPDVEVQNMPILSMHMNYVSVATWGDSKALTPTVLLFNLLSNVTVFNYTTPGSMFDIEVLFNNATIPSSMNNDEYLGLVPYKNVAIPESGASYDLIFLIAAGKHVAASEFGNGGDAYAFQLLIPSSQSYS